MSKSLVFISWSGERAKAVAKALSDWLPGILQSVDAWCSDSTEAGKFWSTEITERLNRAKVGIIVVTPENREKPWLLFEAGAIAKALPSQPDDARAIPYLFELETKDIAPPMSLLQAMKADKEGTLGLVQSINRTLPEPLAEKTLAILYEALYPQLEVGLAAARAINVAEKAPKKRDADEVLAEILESVRALTALTEQDRMANISRERLMNRERPLRAMREMTPDEVLQHAGPTSRAVPEVSLDEFRNFVLNKERFDKHMARKLAEVEAGRTATGEIKE